VTKPGHFDHLMSVYLPDHCGARWCEGDAPLELPAALRREKSQRESVPK